MQTDDSLKLLRADAEAERLATVTNMVPNPWAGAAERLQAAENALYASQAAAEHDRAETEEERRAKALAHAMQTRRTLLVDIHAANVRAAAIERKLHVPEMREAGVLFDSYTRWRTTDIYAGEAEMVFRSFGTFPAHHILFGTPPAMIERMKAYDAVRKEHARELKIAANLQDSVNCLEQEWPALRGLQEAAPAEAGVAQ